MESQEYSALNIWIFISWQNQPLDVCSPEEAYAWVRQLSSTEANAKLAESWRLFVQ